MNTDTNAPAGRSCRRWFSRLVVACAAIVGVLGASSSAQAAQPDVSPVLECVTVNGDGSFTAFFGYVNRSGATETVPAGGSNRLSGAATGTPPTSFQPGRQVAAFSVRSKGPAVVVWKLGNRTASASLRSSPCSTNPTMAEAPVMVLLVAAPALTIAGWMAVQRRRDPDRVAA